ncbi:MAG: hypothetical protein ISS70_22300 [Phycisphaerae bacterium]|nr:hypothetical protein [Phycisphaerae bacterium]
MEDSKKKPVMIGVIVVCLGVAALVTYMRSGDDSGIGGISANEMRWVKCNNPACKAEYEMGTRKYYEDLTANMNPNPMATSATALTCKECNKRSLYGAIKCANPDCGIVFIEGISGPDDHPDRCPDCGKSETQESRKRRLSGG